MKNILFLSVLILAIGAIILSGCSKSVTVTATTSIISTTTTTTTPEPITLIFASNSPLGVGMSVVHEKWMERITTGTGGRVQFVAYWSESLLKDEESFRGVQDGVADISPYNPSEDSGQRLNMVFNVPFVSSSSQTQSGLIYQQLLKEFPEMMAEWPGMIPYAAWTMPEFEINSSDNLIKVPADMAGKKAGTSGEMAKLIRSLGGAPVEMSVGDWYMSLERGLVTVMPTSMQAMEAFGCTELTPYHSFFTGSGYCQPMVLLFNRAKWDSLPEDIKQVFNEAEEWFGPAFTENEMGFLNYVIMPKAQELGHTIYHQTSEETKLWVDAAHPFWDEWIEENSQYGPAAEIVERIQELKSEIPME